MRTPGIFTIHRKSIIYDQLDEPIYLIPFGDIHRFADGCDEERWLEFVDWAKNKKRAYFLGMGDYDDIGSTSERAVLSDRRLHESTSQSLEDYYKYRSNKFINEISWMGDKLIGLLEGNHYAELLSGITTTQYMCNALNAKYLGTNTLLRIDFRQKNRSVILSLDVFAHHGLGGGRRAGSGINKVEDMRKIADADIYLMGDNHQKTVDTQRKIVLKTGNGVLTEHFKKVILARTGSFLEGYKNNKASYVVDALYNPTDLGVIKIEVTPKRKFKDNKDNNYLDIHASL